METLESIDQDGTVGPQQQQQQQQQQQGRVMQQLSLYAPECLILIEQAVENVVGDSGVSNPLQQPAHRASQSRYASSSSDEEGEDQGRSSEEEEGSSDDSAQAFEKTTSLVTSASETMIAQKPVVSQQQQQQQQQIQTVQLEKLIQRQSNVRIRKYVDALTCYKFMLPSRENINDPVTLCCPVALLSREEQIRAQEQPSSALGAFQKLALDLQSNIDNSSKGKPIVVFFIRSGRFAGAVFVQGECMTHHTKTTYTVRKGQGKAQSAQDSQRRPKSIGSQLRRQGEEKLQQDITECALRWKTYLNDAALIFLSCPKTMKKTVFASLQDVLSRDDSRIRRVPLDLGRPTFENAVAIHDVLTTVTIRETIPENNVEETPTKRTSLPATETTRPSENRIQPSPTIPDIPLSALHVACKNGDLDVIRDVLSVNIAELSVMAGPDLMTPLHLAAASTSVVDPSKAAACVTELLVQGHADPGVVDGRSRPPYFLASHDQVRDAFRIARAQLGESYCNWEDAKVGPPLSAEDIQRRKEKEAEKRRKKKARQKQKKAQDKAAVEETEARRQKEEEQAQQEAAAKRIRDGLQPQTTNRGSNVCDFCQKTVKGRQRNQMFKRLEYVYCSTECVQKHKRELMAKAALARFDGH